jgi:hypothetical protein
MKENMLIIKNKGFFLRLFPLAVVFMLLPSCSDMLDRYTGPGPSNRMIETRGKEFFVSFQQNYSVSNPTDLILYITGDTTTSGSISIAGLAYVKDFSVTAHSVTQVNIPSGAMVCSNDLIEDLGIHITSEKPVAVSGINHQDSTTDSFLAYPVGTCGTEYYCMSYESNLPGELGSDFTIVGIFNNTTVNITPTVSSGTHSAGTTYSITLNSGQTYRLYDQVGDVKDVTGSHINADRAIAVFSGNRICDIPTNYPYGDLITEQLLPVSAWDTTYMTVPFKDRTGDTIRVLAAYNGTVISLNGNTMATLNAGEYADTIITGNAVISANNPILAAQFANGSQFDFEKNEFGDPFMLILSGSAQYRTEYTFCTMHEDIGSNYINIIAPTSAISSIRLDGTMLGGDLFSAIDNKYSGAQVPVSQGTHTISGSGKFGLFIYGFGFNDSYGHSGG